MKSQMTTLCYIEKDDSYLMMHRVSKENDINKDKWIGVGGHFEGDECPEECLLREVYEETGLQLKSFCFRGLVTFISNKWQTEYMCLYTAEDFEGNVTNPDGTMRECNEGILEWVKKDDLNSLNLWEGDKIFLNLLAKEVPFFSLKLKYEEDTLVEAILDGKALEI